MTLSTEAVASVAHEANRRYCQLIGDRVLPDWDHLDPQVREGTCAGVRGVMEGVTPGQSHQRWMDHKISQGWTYGPITDDVAKTHKNLVPYDDLPTEQQLKDHLFISIVAILLCL